MGFGHVRVFGLPQGSQQSAVFILDAHWSYAQCAGLHRGLGVHVSFVRSIEMDTWSDVSGVRVTLRRTRLLTLVSFAGPAHCYEGTALFNGAVSTSFNRRDGLQRGGNQRLADAFRESGCPAQFYQDAEPDNPALPYTVKQKYNSNVAAAYRAL